MSITLSNTEITVLQAAAEAGGMLQLSETMRPITRQRMLGRFEAEGLIAVSEPGGIEPHLTPAGYRAIGLRAPRPTKKNAALPSDRPIDEVGPAQAADARETGPRAGTKRALLAEMLGRAEGASLEELMIATGWLPHTTRAALSRIRSSGQTLARSKRADGQTAYRIEADRAA